jgi:mannose-binding lectin 2
MTRCFTVWCLACVLLASLTRVLGKTDVQVANKTIERVSRTFGEKMQAEIVLVTSLYGTFIPASLLCRWAIRNNLNDCFQTLQLRTHSIFPPYIDQDLQNR